jgi:L-alanine-DL-glutamate epimerase-like enolase superfamily enzyme
VSATVSGRESAAPIRRLSVRAYRIPPDPCPESDATAEWDATTLVLVEVEAANARGTGWTYGSRAVAEFVDERLRELVEGHDAFANRELWSKLNGKVRNDERAGLASYAIAAIDVALWDLRARLLDVALCDCLGSARGRVPVYGSGGFTSYDERQLAEQLGGWARSGMRAVKMKVGRDHGADPQRVAWARRAIGPDVLLFVDGNGGYAVEEAIAMANGPFAAAGVCWFEQPVDHRDLAGTARVRDHAPHGMAISSGEYLTDTAYAPAVAAVVDVLQADATRCGGYTGFLAIDGFCEATRKPLSTHCSPMLHLPVAAAALRVRHMEWFHDHVRVERMLFDGFIEPTGGALVPDRSRPGHGLAFRHTDAEKFAW